MTPLGAGSDGFSPIPYMADMLVQKAACTCETPRPTQTPPWQPNPSRMGFPYGSRQPEPCLGR